MKKINHITPHIIPFHWKDTGNRGLMTDTTAHSKSRANNTSDVNSNDFSKQETFEVGRMRELYTFHNDLFDDLDKILFSQII